MYYLNFHNDFRSKLIFLCFAGSREDREFLSEKSEALILKKKNPAAGNDGGASFGASRDDLVEKIGDTLCCGAQVLGRQVAIALRHRYVPVTEQPLNGI